MNNFTLKYAWIFSHNVGRVAITVWILEGEMEPPDYTILNEYQYIVMCLIKKNYLEVWSLK